MDRSHEIEEDVLAETLRELAGAALTDEDGHEERLELRPPATADEIEPVESALSVALPTELREALAVSTGVVNGPLESLDFLALGGFGMEDVFPDADPVGHDGFGNAWVLDLLAGRLRGRVPHRSRLRRPAACGGRKRLRLGPVRPS